MLLEIAFGFLAGLALGLLPGLHPNNVSLILLPLGPLAIAAAYAAQAFSSVLPAVYVGAPSSGAELSVLPAHRMLLSGKAGRAVFVSVASMLISLASFLVLAVPAMEILPERLPRNLVLAVLVFFSAVLVLFEEKKLLAAAFFLASAIFGTAFASSENLFPIFAGFFGASTLVGSILSRGERGDGAAPRPGKMDARKAAGGSVRPIVFPAVAGSLCGAAVGIFPALTVSVVSSAASVALFSGLETEEFLALSSSAGFSAFLFSLLSAARMGVARNGTIAAAVSSGWGPGMLWRTVLVVSASACAAAFLARFMLLPVFRRIGKFRRLNEISLAVLAVSVALFSGARGLLVFALSCAIGVSCAKAGVGKRVLMGALLGRSVLSYLRA